MLFGSSKPKATAPYPAPNGPGTGVVFDVGVQDFETRVIHASLAAPVIVQFWAPWCGPCKQLGPVLEAAVTAAGGAVTMARVNLDTNQELAAALRIQSVPTVYAFFQGRPVDGFQGSLPESQVKDFIARMVQVARSARPDALDVTAALKQAADLLAAGDLTGAQGLYVQVLEQEPENAKAYAGIVRSFIAAGEIDQAEGFVKNAPEGIANDPAFTEARTALELAQIKPSGDLAQFAARLETNPDDHQARFDLALAQFAAGQKEEAIDSLLEIVSRNRDWNEQAGRHQLLKVFEALGPSDPLTIAGRRRLSSILFS